MAHCELAGMRKFHPLRPKRSCDSFRESREKDDTRAEIPKRSDDLFSQGRIQMVVAIDHGDCAFDWVFALLGEETLRSVRMTGYRLKISQQIEEGLGTDFHGFSQN